MGMVGYGLKSATSIQACNLHSLRAVAKENRRLIAFIKPFFASDSIVKLYKHAAIFKKTREVHREARGAAECFSHSSSVLKNSQVLI